MANRPLTRSELEKRGHFDPLGFLKPVMGQVKNVDGRLVSAEGDDEGLVCQTYSGSAGLATLNSQIVKVSEAVQDQVDDADDKKSEAARSYAGAALVRIDDYPSGHTGESKQTETLYGIVSASARGASLTLVPESEISELGARQKAFYNHQLVTKIASKIASSDLAGMKDLTDKALRQMLANGEINQNELNEILRIISINAATNAETFEEALNKMPWRYREAFSAAFHPLLKKSPNYAASLPEPTEDARNAAANDLSNYFAEKVRNSIEEHRLMADVSVEEAGLLSSYYGVTTYALEIPLPHNPFSEGVSFLRNKRENSVSVLFKGDSDQDTAWVYITGTENCYVRVRRHDAGVPMKAFCSDGKGNVVEEEISEYLDPGEVVIDEGVVFQLDEKGKYTPKKISGLEKAEQDCCRKLTVKAMSLNAEGQRSMSVMENGNATNLGFLSQNISKNDAGEIIDTTKIDANHPQYAPLGIAVHGLNHGGHVAEVAQLVLKIGSVGPDSTPHLKIPVQPRGHRYEAVSDSLLQRLGCRPQDVKDYKEKFEYFLENGQMSVKTGTDLHGNDIYGVVYPSQACRGRVEPISAKHLQSGREFIDVGSKGEKHTFKTKYFGLEMPSATAKNIHTQLLGGAQVAKMQGYYYDNDFRKRTFSKDDKKDDTVVLFGGNENHVITPGSPGGDGQAAQAGIYSDPLMNGTFAFPITTQCLSKNPDWLAGLDLNIPSPPPPPPAAVNYPAEMMRAEVKILKMAIDAGANVIIPTDAKGVPSMPGNLSHNVFKDNNGAQGKLARELIDELKAHQPNPPTDPTTGSVIPQDAKEAVHALRKFVYLRKTLIEMRVSKGVSNAAQAADKIASIVNNAPANTSLFDVNQAMIDEINRTVFPAGIPPAGIMAFPPFDNLQRKNPPPQRQTAGQSIQI